MIREGIQPSVIAGAINHALVDDRVPGYGVSKRLLEYNIALCGINCIKHVCRAKDCVFSRDYDVSGDGHSKFV
ncbi:MAG: hypothetical protein BWY72_02246 [Bacteroidetes bacterium ADurb.Bin416]|nr:MAG: hypothetical protein BWY72_02246 [Bacteroidetes bacterium ADurb.Bin416]